MSASGGPVQVIFCWRLAFRGGLAAPGTDYSFLEGEDGDLNAIAQAQPGENVGDMALYGGLAEAESGRDLGVRQALGDQVE